MKKLSKWLFRNGFQKAFEKDSRKVFPKVFSEGFRTAPPKRSSWKELISRTPRPQEKTPPQPSMEHHPEIPPCPSHGAVCRCAYSRRWNVMHWVMLHGRLVGSLFLGEVFHRSSFKHLRGEPYQTGFPKASREGFRNCSRSSPPRLSKKLFVKTFHKAFRNASRKGFSKIFSKGFPGNALEKLSKKVPVKAFQIAFQKPFQKPLSGSFPKGFP